MDVDRRRFITNLAFKSLSIPIEKLSRLLIVVAAAPILGAETFGIYQFSVTLTSLLILGTELGLGTWTTRALARDLASAPAVVATALRIRAWAAPLYLIVIAVVALAQPENEARVTVAILGITALGNAYVDYLGAIFRGHERLSDEAMVNVARAIAITIGALLALRLAPSVTSLATGLMVGTLVSMLLASSILRSRYRLAAWPRLRGGARVDAPRSQDRALVQRALSEALPLWVTGLFSALYFRCDVMILRALTGDAAVGVYSAAYRLFEVTMVAPALFLAVAFPRLARVDDDRGRRRRFEEALLAVLAGAGLAVGATLRVAGAWIVRVVYGPAYASAVPCLEALAFATPCLFVNFGLTHMLIARGQERRYALIAAAMLVFNVAINFVSIPLLGGLGAAWATGLTEVLLGACCVVALARRPARPAARSGAEP